MKEDVEYLEPMWPMRHFLITCGKYQGKSNIITVSFCMPVSKEPPMIAISIGENTYSNELMDKNKEFIVNVPTKSMKSQIYYCGFHSGYKVDKFQDTELSPLPARKLEVPIISECVAHMECRIVNKTSIGDKILITGEVLESYADKQVLNKKDINDFAYGSFPRQVYAGRFIKNDQK